MKIRFGLCRVKPEILRKATRTKLGTHISNCQKIRLETREKRKKYLIVCEGQTEEWYFRQFPVVTAEVISLGLGMTHFKLIEEAKKRSKQDKYDEVWCVFDLDFNAEQNGQFEDYNNAVFADDKEKKIRCAYSNDAFELWFYLHYQFTEQSNLRQFYYERLSNIWDMSYEREGKKQEFSKSIYRKLKDDLNSSQQMAIERAKRLLEKHKDITKPHEKNPITTVFELVEMLNEHIEQ